MLPPWTRPQLFAAPLSCWSRSLRQLLLAPKVTQAPRGVHVQKLPFEMALKLTALHELLVILVNSFRIISMANEFFPPIERDLLGAIE